MTDEIVMYEVAKGDLDKSALLFERYKNRIYCFYMRFGVGKENAQDLTQQVFYRVIRYRTTYKEGYEFKTWIYRIARNIYHDFLRENKFVFEEFQNHQMANEEETNDEEEYFLTLNKALNSLGQEYKEVILMSRYEGMNYEKISQVLNISVSLVKVRVHRGLKQLKEFYFQLS